jgi:hypothetical protein
MTKKKKELILQEKEKKLEERQKIMGEWSEEEEGEAEERRKINETLGKSEDDSGNFKYKLQSHIIICSFKPLAISWN